MIEVGGGGRRYDELRTNCGENDELRTNCGTIDELQRIKDKEAEFCIGPAISTGLKAS